MADEVIAESSTAVETHEIPRDPDAYAAWRTTGKLPEAQEAAPADAAKELESEAKTEEVEAETAPDSEREDHQEPPRKGKGAQARIAELVAQRRTAEERVAALERELADARKGPKPAEAKAETKVEVKQPEPTRPKPKPDDKNPDGSSKFKTYEDFAEDLADWKAEQREVKLRAELKAEAQREAQSKAIADKLAEGRDRYEDFDKVMPPTLNTIMNDAEIPVVVKAIIGDSDVLPHLLYVMGSDADEFAEFIALAHTQPGQALRKVVLLERLVHEELAGEGEKPTPERGTDGKFVTGKAPEKKISDAPPLGTEVSGRGHAPADEVETSVKSGDFTTFKNARNRADMARRKGM